MIYKGSMFMRYSKRYKKNLTHLTTVRLSEKLREEAGRSADYLGISFSDFIRQSLVRNIKVSSGIEEEVSRQSLERALGR
ncbi:hypothetical protein EB001_12370 [bacterium]|nr:hypothetical protein [bacterium]